MHGPDEAVSRRTRQRCIDRINRLHWKQAALQHDRTLEPSASTSTTTAPAQSGFGPVFSSLTDDPHAELELLPPTQTEPDNEDDTTMPTWSVPLDSDRFEYGARGDRSSEGEEDLPAGAPSSELDTGSGYGTDTGLPSLGYDLAAEWSTDIGYTSGSEADIEADVESHSELDNLLQISPASSRAGSPIVGIDMDDTGDFEPEVSL